MQQLQSPGGGSECQEAFASVRFAKNCLWWLLLLAMLVQLGGVVAVRFVGVLDESRAVSSLKPVSAGSAPATKPAATAGNESAETWHVALRWALPATKFIGTAGGLLLVLTLLVGVMLCLVGRTGGMAGFISAFFWALVMWVMLIPWQQVTGATFASGATFNLTDLMAQTRKVAWGAADVSISTQTIYYARFLAYPLVVVGVLLMVQAKFARGYRRVRLSVTPAEAPVETEPGPRM